jgi:dihydrodipicolinate synthase/N-acetylneuraminate lyase
LGIRAQVQANTSNFCCYKIENGNATYTKSLLRRSKLKDVAFMYGGAPSQFEQPLLRVGAGIRAAMSILAQGVGPELSKTLWRSIERKDWATFNATLVVTSELIAGLRSAEDANGAPLSPLMTDGFPGGLESGIRAALEVKGVSHRYLREPQDHASDAEMDVVKALLAKLKLL